MNEIDQDAILEQVSTLLTTGDGLMSFGLDMRIQSWNAELERLTGIAASEALGRPCWEVLRAVDGTGALVCEPGCRQFQFARGGWPVRSRRLSIRVRAGRRTLAMGTVLVGAGDDRVLAHTFRDGDDPAGAGGAAVEAKLTPRQREVLELLASGAPAKVVALRLGIREPTVRNHIRAILTELGAHSQLEAVAIARRIGLLD